MRTDRETLRKEGELLLRQADHLLRLANNVTTDDPMEKFGGPAKIGDYRNMKRPESAACPHEACTSLGIASRCLQ